MLILGLIFLVGVLAAFINVLAGGGSVLTLGIMMIMGLDAATANGTNRVALLFGAFSAAYGFYRAYPDQIKKQFKISLWSIPAALGGAYLAIHVPNDLFKQILGFVMIGVILSLYFPVSKTGQGKKWDLTNPWLAIPVLFLIGFYGGFIQAGVGLVMMGLFRHLFKLDLVTVNRLKIFIVLVYTIPVLLVFGIGGFIDWPMAIALSCGNIVGAWIAVKMSLKKGDSLVKIALTATLIILLFKLWVG